MKEINIAKTLIAKRKEKGITQEDLAYYIGISKASVSKWETGQSYPDITFLPQLAAYFNISIDELIDYAPQMTKEDSSSLYKRLAKDFSCRPFDEVLEECHQIIKKYYSCFPLLLDMTILLLNHVMLIKDTSRQETIIQEIIELCSRIQAESNDLWLAQSANSIKANCWLMLKNPLEVLELLDTPIVPVISDVPLLATAYQMTSNTEKAMETLQASIYMHLQEILGNSILLMNIYHDSTEKAEQLIQRTLTLNDVFHMDQLNVNTSLVLYITIARSYVNSAPEKALDFIQRYADLCMHLNPVLLLHGDDFFDCLDEWFKKLPLGTQAPRDGKFIRESMLQAITCEPAFAPLLEHPRFQNIIAHLRHKLFP